MNRTQSRRAQYEARGKRGIVLCSLLSALCLLILSSIAQAQGVLSPDLLPKNSEPKIVQPESAPKSNLPAPLRQVGIDQKLNNQVPLDLVFTDENGQQVRLGQYFGQKPVILSLVYYDCPMLCTQVLTELAREKKANYMARYGRPNAADGWHFLTGDEASITALTNAVGFRFAWDEETKQFAHASGIMILTPEGRVSRYFYGIEYAPRDMQLGLVEASNNKIGSPVDQLLLYCYHYDPQTGKYGFVIMNAMRVLGFATFFGLALLIVIMKRREAGRHEALREV
jgi:protein SCO1